MTLDKLVGLEQKLKSNSTMFTHRERSQVLTGHNSLHVSGIESL